MKEKVLNEQTVKLVPLEPLKPARAIKNTIIYLVNLGGKRGKMMKLKIFLLLI